jgi:hypothetical protein
LAGHVACIGQRKCLAENLKEEITPEKCLPWKVMLKWILKLMWCEYEDGQGLARGKNQAHYRTVCYCSTEPLLASQ